MNTDAMRLLDAVCGRATAGFIELRMIDRRGGPPRQKWFPIADREAAAREAVALSETFDVYFGVVPRTREEGTKDAVGEARVVWADLDSADATIALAGFEVAPSAVVASGSPGCHHAYWLLEEPVPRDLLEQINRRLAVYLGGDERVTDAGRILRVPGTLNHKADPPRPVTLQQLTGEVHPLDRLLAALPDAVAEEPPVAATNASEAVSEPVANVLAKLDTVRPSGTGWTALCPGHDDHRPSLSVTQGDDGRCLINCHAGCSPDDVLAALDLSPADLFVTQRGRRSARDVLLDTVDDEAVDLFPDPRGRAYAKFVVNGHLETVATDSQRCSDWLQYVYYCRHGSAAPAEAISDAIRNMSARARFEGTSREVHRRVGGDLERLWIDLGDPDHTYAEVRDDGTWSIRDRSDVEFVRESGMLPLPSPKRDGDLDRLRPLVNLPDPAAWTVFRGALIAAFHPHGPYYVTYLHGPGGSGKTHAARRFAALSDPFEAQFLTGNVSPKDVLVAAASCRLLGLDNLSRINTAMSDTLCVVSTGASDKRRALYTNADVFSLKTKNPALLVAMVLLATRGDLIDRLAPVRLERISTEQRERESVLHDQFASEAPLIFGGLLDTLAAALKHVSEVQLDDVPRMADAALFVTAAEHGLNTPVGTFAETMVHEQGDALRDTIQSAPFVEAIVRFMATKDKWAGSATLLMAEADKLARDGRRARGWPTNPSAASALLTEYELPLGAHGLTFDRGRSPGGTRDRKLTLRNDRSGTAGTGGTVDGSEPGR